MSFKTEDIKIRFYLVAKEHCECCNKKIFWCKQDVEGDEYAWHAHHILPQKIKDDSSIKNMEILCTHSRLNCHFNHGHGGLRQKLLELYKTE